MNVKLYMGARFLFCAMCITLIAACPMPEPTPEPEPTVPGTMAAPTLKAGNEQLIATWTAPNNGGSEITAYELQYRTGSGAWTEITEGITGTNTSHTITGLTKASEYDVQVRAVNEIGAGDWSESAAETPPATVPDAPAAPTLYAGTGRLVALWTAPEDDGGSPITGYELQYRTGGGAWTEIAPAPGKHDHTIDGLTNDAEYEVQARAVNEVGDSGWSMLAMKTPTDSAIRTSAGMAADVNLSAALNEIIASEKPAVYVTTGTHTVKEGDIEPTSVATPPGITPPTYDPLTGTTITVTTGTTAGTYLVYGIKPETGDILFAEYLYVTVSPDDAVAAGGDADDDGGNGELKTAVTTGISTWGNTADLNYIITTAVTNMSEMFNSNTTFNGDISLWDTGAVTNMGGMFASAIVFNGDISLWDTGAVTNMNSMFIIASAFNGDISGWDVSEVTDMFTMFNLASAFNGDISDWDVSKVTDMFGMFYQASAFNQDLEEWKDHWSLAAGTLNSAGKYTGTTTNMFLDSGVTTTPSWY